MHITILNESSSLALGALRLFRHKDAAALRLTCCNSSSVKRRQRSNAKTIQNRGDVMQSLVARGRHIGPGACSESIKHFKAHPPHTHTHSLFSCSLPPPSLSRRLFSFQPTHLIIYRLLVTCSYRLLSLARA